jgi:chromosome segregation ATPase
MFSLRPKEGGTPAPPSPPESNWIKPALIVALVLIVALGYGLYSANASLSQKISDMQLEMNQQIQAARNDADKASTAMASDIDVITERLGVTTQDLTSARKFAEALRQETQQAKQQLANELATKATSSDLTAARQEAATKVAEVQQDATSKIGTVSGEVKTVAANLDATRNDLADSRREITDVRSTLSQQIARNASELDALRLKGERDYFEFTLAKGKKNVFTRVADVQLELRNTDTKKQKYDVVLKVDDSVLEKKDRTANEPVQFLVGRDKLRYELVVNTVDKDRIRGYLSAPKDKVLAAERPAFRQ